MVDEVTYQSLFDTKTGFIAEGDLLLITVHTIREKNISAKVNLELDPCLDEDEFGSVNQSIQLKESIVEMKNF